MAAAGILLGIVGAGVASRHATPTHELVPARVFLTAGAIPPRGVAAYGVVALRSMATSSTKDRLLRVCEAYKAYLPKQSSLPATVPLAQQMLTVWPLDQPGSPQAKADDCDFAVAHYDLYGGLSAVADAAKQGAKVDGEGPYLIGWSPSNTRGLRDKLVLVVDMSGLDSQDSFNESFFFWQRKVVENPEMWRYGFSIEKLRLTLRDFADQYGQEIINAVKLTSNSEK
jgi:hypothetical protein